MAVGFGDDEGVCGLAEAARGGADRGAVRLSAEWVEVVGRTNRGAVSGLTKGEAGRKGRIPKKGESSHWHPKTKGLKERATSVNYFHASAV